MSYSIKLEDQKLIEVIHKLILAETTKTYRLRHESDAKKLIEDQPETISSLTNVWKDYAAIWIWLQNSQINMGSLYPMHLTWQS